MSIKLCPLYIVQRQQKTGVHISHANCDKTLLYMTTGDMLIQNKCPQLVKLTKTKYVQHILAQMWTTIITNVLLLIRLITSHNTFSLAILNRNV